MNPLEMTRRGLLQGVAVGAVTTPLATLAQENRPQGVVNGNIQQSVAHWCFASAGEKWDLDKPCSVAKGLGCKSVELLGPEQWPTLKKHGLVCAMASNGVPGGFKKGFNNTAYRDEVITRTKAVIDQCAAAGFPNVIAFTGFKYRKFDDPASGEITRDDGERNCIEGFKQIVGYAEQKKVTICVEHLNTRDDSHPMKGHPGYQGDDLDWLAGIVRKVGSPRLKLLFDIYHVQIMHGDVIRRIDENHEIIGHIHTAGNPGRGELDDTQEINYSAVMKKLLAVKYAGYVGQEFIPTRDPLTGLAEAVRKCDV